MNVSLPTNSSLQPEVDQIEFDHAILVLFTVIMSFLTIAMTVGNIFVISALIVIKPHLFASDQLTINQCVAGSILGLLVMPYGTMTTYLRVPVWGENACRAMAFIKMVAIYSTNLTLPATGIDRYIKVKYNTIHRARSKKVLILIGVIWLVSLLSALPPLVGWGWYRWVQQKPICTNDWISSTSYTIFLVIFFMIIPLMIVFFCYGSIVRIVVQSRRRLDVHQQNNTITNDVQNTLDRAESMQTKSVQNGENTGPIRWASGRNENCANSLAVSVIRTPSVRVPSNAVAVEAPSNSHQALKPPRDIKLPQDHPRPMKYVNRADLAVIRTMIIVVSTYVIFWYPYIICMLIKTATKERMSFIVETVTIELAFLGMALNPVIYAVSNRGFRRDLRTALKKVCKPDR